MATTEFSVRKRPHQACQNCRRKKTRCPGEKPSCSSCVRLGQRCSYVTSKDLLRGRQPVEERLAFLEEKMDMMLNGVGDNEVISPKQTPNAFEMIAEPLICSDDDLVALNKETQESCLLPPSTIMSRALDIYYECFHRHPIWCFNREDMTPCEAIADELVCSIMALTCRFLPRNERLEHYSDRARSLIMLRIANGTVRLATIESLCLLSLSFLQDGDMDLGQFHLRLGIELCQSAQLDLELTYQEADPFAERKKRVFSSFQLLEQYHGRNTELLYAPADSQGFSSLRESNCSHSKQHQPSQSPPLPHDDGAIPLSTDLGIWAYTTQLGWVWSKVRTYVSDCYHYRLQNPWLPSSTYTILQSELLESENMLPMFHRWDLAKFWAREPNDVKIHLAYWIPWLKLQFTYHAAHTLLNHPFLYIAASQHNQDFAIPNTFWKRSSHLVLLHATWIVRLIDMVSEKKVRLTDPFFAHIAAIAATVHLHFCHAADPRLKVKSNSELAKCKSFLKSFESFSGSGRALSDLLENVLQVASSSSEVDADDRRPPTIRLNILRMWEILQFKHGLGPQTLQMNHLFNQSLKPVVDQRNAESSILEVYVTTPAEVSINTLDGGQAAPVRSMEADHIVLERSSTRDSGIPGLIPPMDGLRSDTSWLWANVPNENVSSPGESGAPLATLEPIESTWWNFGNL